MKISRQKRQQLVLVVILTLGAVAGIWFALIHTQNQKLHALAERRTAAIAKLELIQKAIDNSERVETQLAESSKVLAKNEEGMASGDLYSWAITTIRQFKQPYKIEIPQYSQIDGPKDVSILPQFPYKQATVTIGGTAYFHDFGSFLADLENHFPYMRVQNLTLEPVSSMLSPEREKLGFRMDIVMLVKPTAS